MNRITWIFCCLFFCEMATLQAQNWTIYNSSNSGLLDNNIKCLAVDQMNRKWVGTSYGLGMYNDTTWTIYTTQNSNLPDDNILSLGIDQYNMLWVGTNNAGLAKFDGSNWTVWNVSNSNLPNDEIKCIAFDTLGNKWLGTANGLVKFNDTAIVYWNLNNSGLFLVNIPAIAIDKQNVKHISSINSGIFDYNDTTFTNYLVSNSNLQDNSVFCLVMDSSSSRWYGTAGQGLMAHHPDNITWEWYYPGNTPAFSAYTIYSLLIDSLQRKYAGTELTGLVRYDGTNWVYWETLNTPLPSNKVRSLAEENNGILWIGTQNGLARFNPSIITSAQEQVINDILLYPNPVQNDAYISVPSAIEKPLMLEIQDILGKVIYTKTFTPGNHHLTITGLTEGMYVYRLYNQEVNSGVKKLIVQGN